MPDFSLEKHVLYFTLKNRIDFFLAFAQESQLGFFIDEEKSRSKNQQGGGEREDQARGMKGGRMRADLVGVQFIEPVKTGVINVAPTIS